jgi:hypothetical protein
MQGHRLAFALVLARGSREVEDVNKLFMLIDVAHLEIEEL